MTKKVIHLSPSIISGLDSSAAVQGYSHRFYRYPARFSPEFVRSVIKEFTAEGATVVDPFLGGGTTAVEALALGRRFIGVDINPLATFVSKAKTTPLSMEERFRVLRWQESLPDAIRVIRVDRDIADHSRHIPWWLRDLFVKLLSSTESLSNVNEKRFVRCSILKTAQWALDCRRAIPCTSDFVSRLNVNVSEMLRGIELFKRDFEMNSKGSSIGQRRRILTTSAENLMSDKRIPEEWLAPSLILTSPPYPGVHILYHRWQVRGRRETPAPYWLTGCQDGHGAAHYTFGDRKRSDSTFYLENVSKCFSTVADMMDKKTILLQLVAFANPKVQLPEYLDTLADLGLVESGGYGSTLFRRVPNRKWYATVNGPFNSSREFLLIHKKS